MAIITYDDIVRTVRSWANRQDISDEDMYTFLYFTGSMANQTLRVPPMEDSRILTVTPDGHVVIPDDFLELRSMTAMWNSEESVPLERVGWDQYVTYKNFGPQNQGNPCYYSRQGPYWFFAPSPPAGSQIMCHFYRNMPDISPAEATNWLSDLSPMGYVFGGLHYLYLFVQDEERAEYWRQKMEGEFTRIQALYENTEYKGTQLAVRDRFPTQPLEGN